MSLSGAYQLLNLWADPDLLATGKSGARDQPSMHFRQGIFANVKWGRRGTTAEAWGTLPPLVLPLRATYALTV